MGTIRENSRSTENQLLPNTVMNKHPENMSLNNFKLGLIRGCSATQLDREENRFITKLRTEVIGLNRMKVIS